MNPGASASPSARALLANIISVAKSEQFQSEEALDWAKQSWKAAREWARLHPSEIVGGQLHLINGTNVAALQYRAGCVTEALATLREIVTLRAEQPGTAEPTPWLYIPWQMIARKEAQRGNFEAARQALAQAKRSVLDTASRVGWADPMTQNEMETVLFIECEVDLAQGETARALDDAEAAASRMERIRQSAPQPFIQTLALSFQRASLAQASLAALRLRLPEAAERHANALFDLPLDANDVTLQMFLCQPEEPAWRHVLRAEAMTLQGRLPEALQTIAPALETYRDMKSKGATHLTFRQRFARALYVQALAQPSDAAGLEQRRASLTEAANVLAELTEEARQLRDTKELLGWIEAEQRKLGQGAQP